MIVTANCSHCETQNRIDTAITEDSPICTACARPLTISLPCEVTPARRGGGVTLLLAIFGLGAIGLVFCTGVVGLLYSGVQGFARPASEKRHTSQSLANLRKIQLALLNYEADYGSFPPACVVDGQGKPLYSWRLLILPYLDQQSLYERFDKSKAWDDSANRAVSNSSAVAEFHSPDDVNVDPSGTNYFCLVGDTTLFPEKVGRRRNAVSDGLAQTVSVVELTGIRGSWAAPIDPRLSQVEAIVGDMPSQLHPVRAHDFAFSLGDGTVRLFARRQAEVVIKPAVFIIDDEETPAFR